MPDLDRFLQAQDAAQAGYRTALAELARGHKTSHWIWYVLPQIAGLGRSGMAQRFGIADLAEARAYLAHPVLGARLLETVATVRRQLTADPPVPLVTLLGSPIDAQKLVSSLTLFGHVARHWPGTEADARARAVELADHAAAILEVAAAQGWPACAVTERWLAAAARS